MTDLEADLIRENVDTLDVTVHGNFRTIPQCKCGKCIVRRLRGNHNTEFPYNKDMHSTYIDDYGWKTGVKDDPNSVYNRAKHNSFEGGYKEHLPSTLISTAKMCYRPFLVKKEEKKEIPVEECKVPLLGRSTYLRDYPSWGKIQPPKKEGETQENIIVPLRGVSNYKESYPKYNDRYYSNAEPLNFQNSTLKFNGDLDPRTTYNDNYKPNDLSNKNYFPDEEPINTAKGENNVLKSAPILGNTLSTYRRDYVPYEDKECKLRKYLNARGIRYLVI